MTAIIFFAIAFLIFLICFYAWRDVIRRYPPDFSDSTYSYKRVFKGTLTGLIIVPIATLLVYILSKSLEVTISLGAFFLCFVLCYFVWGIHWQRWEKNRGATKED